MSLPGLFVEYLVIGTIALLWLWPLVSILTPLIPQKEIFSLLLIPILYVVGMMVDYVGYLLLPPIRDRIRERVYKQYGEDGEKFLGLEPRLLVHAPELANLRTIYSSRDRVARGTTINALIASVTFIICFWRNHQWYWMQVAVIASVIVVIFCYLLWANYQRSSYRLVVYSFRALNEKLQLEYGNNPDVLKWQIEPDQGQPLTSRNRVKSRKR